MQGKRQEMRMRTCRAFPDRLKVLFLWLLWMPPFWYPWRLNVCSRSHGSFTLCEINWVSFSHALSAILVVVSKCETFQRIDRKVRNSRCLHSNKGKIGISGRRIVLFMVTLAYLALTCKTLAETRAKLLTVELIRVPACQCTCQHVSKQLRSNGRQTLIFEQRIR